MLGAGPPQEALDCRRGRGSRPPGGEAAAAADWPVPVHPEGRARPGAAVPGAEARGVALGAGSAALGGRGGPSGSGLGARRGGTRRSQDSGKPLPSLGRVFAGLRGCGRPAGSGEAAGRSRGEKLGCAVSFCCGAAAGTAL